MDYLKYNDGLRKSNIEVEVDNKILMCKIPKIQGQGRGRAKEKDPRNEDGIVAAII